MADVYSVNRRLQVGKESTPGVLVPATKRLQTIKATIDSDAATQNFVPSGNLYATVATLSKEMATGRLDAQPSYGELLWLLSMLLGAPTTADQPSGGHKAFRYKWTKAGTDLIQPVTFTGESGNDQQVDKVGYLALNGFTMQIDRNRIAGNGGLFGQKIDATASLTALSAVNDVQTLTVTATGGTYTLAVWGTATAAIAFGANAAAIQAALALVVGAGNVTVTGPGPYVITFGGALGNQLIPAIVVDPASLSGGTASIVHTTPGNSITPEPTAQPVVPNQIDVFCDTSPGSFGSTQFLRTFDAQWAFTDTQDQGWALNSSAPSFTAIAPKVPKPVTSASLMMDAQGKGFLDAIRAGTRQYMRLLATGPLIEGTIHYSLQIDQALNISKAGGTKDVNGFHTRSFDATLMDDPLWGKAIEVTLVCAVPALV